MRTVVLAALLVAAGCRKAIDDVDVDTSADTEADTEADTSTDIQPDDLDGDGITSDVDCDDTNALVYPDADELCDGLDNDCDGAVDNEPVDAVVWYVDADGDGFGDDATAVSACDAPEDGVLRGGDCDDASAAASPTGTERCDGLDNDCDGSVDIDALDAVVVYADSDADGYGAGDALTTCEPSDGQVTNDADCNDDDPLINPLAAETCNGTDDDCDGRTDNGAADAGFFYVDSDGDGFGTNTIVVACDAPQGTAASPGDCDDNAPAVNPSAPEVCNGTDDNCNNLVDDGAIDRSPFYVDLDGDGFGVREVLACSQPDGTADQPGDCLDFDASVYPQAPEQCDGADNDCDGVVDNDAEGQNVFYQDNDNDQYGSTISVQACDAPDGFVSAGGDCDDEDPSRRPGNPEACNGIDDDCDGERDDGLETFPGYVDSDADGFGDVTTVEGVCSLPDGWTDVGSDCNDLDPTVYPDAPEACDDGIDNDCDADVDCADTADCEEIDAVCWECGDGVVDPNETCDDGNLDPLDGCSADCELEFDFLELTTCGASGATGPSQQQCDVAYAGIDETVMVLEGIQYWTVPATGTYRITAVGARGGDHGRYQAGGFGAMVEGDFLLQAGEELKILVGQRGVDGNSYDNSAGGGTFVARADDTPLIVAGGGGADGNCGNRGEGLQEGSSEVGALDGPGGVSSNDGTWCGCGGAGSGGGGFFGDGGGGGGLAFVNGGAGDTGTRPSQCVTVGPGGFGGGGNGGNGGGGGGGYEGGAGGGSGSNDTAATGEGGKSYNDGDNAIGQSGENAGDGFVMITANP